VDSKTIYAPLVKRESGGVVLDTGGEAAGQLAIELKAKRLLKKERLKKWHGNLFRKAVCTDEDRSDSVLAFGVLEQIASETFEFIEWQMRFGVDAELDSAGFLNSTVPVVLPSDHKVIAFNLRKVVCSLND
jgi:hypothetical protein